MTPNEKSARLQQLIHRKDKVLAVLHPPTATHGRIMQRAGCEAGFVGTSGVVGSYTGLADVGILVRFPRPYGPDGVSARVLDVTRNVVRLQTGYLYHYAFAMLIGVVALVTWYLLPR